MPPQTLDSCSFCWNESAGSKFKVVYEVRRTLNYLAFANEIGYLRMIHSQLLRIESRPVDTIFWSSPSDTLVCKWSWTRDKPFYAHNTKWHIESIRSLRSSDVKLGKQPASPMTSTRRSHDVAVKSMEEIGHVVLNKLEVPLSERRFNPSFRALEHVLIDTIRFGFHIPPFNSVNHLHLHVHALPYLNNVLASKYPLRPGYNGYSKGLSWFVEVQQAIQILERGNRVGILPC